MKWQHFYSNVCILVFSMHTRESLVCSLRVEASVCARVCVILSGACNAKMENFMFQFLSTLFAFAQNAWLRSECRGTQHHNNIRIEMSSACTVLRCTVQGLLGLEMAQLLLSNKQTTSSPANQPAMERLECNSLPRCIFLFSILFICPYFFVLFPAVITTPIEL